MEILCSFITLPADMHTYLDVNGAATDASAMESEMPACAVLSAPQSLQPSPHMITWRL